MLFRSLPLHHYSHHRQCDMEGSKSRTHKRRHDKEITHKLALLQEPPNSSQISGGRWTYHNHVDLNPNATDIRITIPHSDDEFIDLFGAVLIITLSVLNADGSDHGDMLFQAGQLRINTTATEYIDSYGILGYIQTLLGMMPDTKKSCLECEGWFEDKVVIMAPTMPTKSREGGKLRAPGRQQKM